MQENNYSFFYVSQNHLFFVYYSPIVVYFAGRTKAIDLEKLRSEISSDAQHCPYCGKKIDKSFTYCPHCGGRIKK